MTWSPCGERELHADHDRFLADVEMAEAADQAHAVHLARLLLEPADQQHVAVGLELGVLAEIGDRVAGGPAAGSRNGAGGVGKLFVIVGERH